MVTTFNNHKILVDDTSKSFEKTDIYIEKSVNTSFDIIDTTPINSLVDLGKFIFNEKLKCNGYENDQQHTHIKTRHQISWYRCKAVLITSNTLERKSSIQKKKPKKN